MAFDSCTICTYVYDALQRKPWDLGCGHCVCQECWLAQNGSGRLVTCPECRELVKTPHLQWAMLRLLERSGVKSFPIGAAADADDEPSPPPSPCHHAAQARPCSAEGPNTPSSSSSPSAPCLSSLRSSSLCPPGLPSGRLYPDLTGLLPTAASSSSSSRGSGSNSSLDGMTADTSAAAGSASLVPAPTAASGGPCSRQGYCPCPSPTPSSCSQGEQQRLVSYPVFDHEDADSDADIPAAAEGEGTHGTYTTSSSSDRGALQWLRGLQVPGWLQQPWQLVTTGRINSCEPDAGWPLCGPSLAWAAASSWQRCTAACCCTYLVGKALTAHGQHLLLQRFDRGLRQLRLPGSGQDAAMWLLTVFLGVLAYHWAAGLLVLPLLAAAALAGFFVLLPMSHDGHTLLPFKSAGVLLAVFGGLLTAALASAAASPSSAAVQRAVVQVAPHCVQLLGVLLLGQVAAEAWERGASSEEEAAFQLLVVRVLLLAAAAWAGGAAVAVWLALYLQKAWVCHQCGALVRSLHTLVQKHYGSAGALTLVGEGSPKADHGMLLLLVAAAVLFVPPGALAPSPWVPVSIAAVLVWAFRVFACGYAVRTGMGIVWRTAEAVAVPFGCLPDRSIVAQLLRSYWQIVTPLVLLVTGDTFLCAAAPAARGVLQGCGAALLLGLLLLEVGQLAVAEVRHVQQMVKVAARRQAAATAAAAAAVASVQ